VHCVVRRGPLAAFAFAGLGLTAGAAGEYVAVNVSRIVRHHARPQIEGIPIAAVLSWYSIIYGAFSSAELVLDAIATQSHPRRALAMTLGTAWVATSLDLVLDAYGLDRGFWEWNVAGSFARDVTGPNGRRGIPLINFGGWLILSAAVAALFVLLMPGRPEARPKSMISRLGALLLLPYYVPAAIWAVQTRRVRFLVYSALVPAVALVGTARRGA
jgi:putative membrane protein